MARQFPTVGLVGPGTMGVGFAEVMARAGIDLVRAGHLGRETGRGFRDDRR